MSIKSETLAWLRQTATTDGATYSQVLLNLLERVEVLEAKYETQRLATLEWGKDVDKLMRWIDDHLKRIMALEQPKQDKLDRLIALDQDDDEPAPPAALSDALIRAECALSDIAEGLPTDAAPNTFEWAEQRCAETLATIRPMMQQHKIRTSEWPPVSQHTSAAESAADIVLLNCPETCWVEIRRIADGKVIYSNHRKGELIIPVGEPPAPPPAPVGGLAERVRAAIIDDMVISDLAAASASIREVAAWLDRYGCHGCSLWLREEIDQ